MKNSYYNPLDIETLQNPYPIYDRLREERPVFYHDEMKSWVLTQYEDCKLVLSNNEIFARDIRRIGKDLPEIKQNLQSLDPPENKGIRSLSIQASNTKDKQEFTNNIREFIDESFFNVKSKEEFDFMREISAPLSLRITCELLGVEEPEINSYLRISDDIAHQMDGGLNPEYIEPGNIARKKFDVLVEKWFASHSNDQGMIQYIRNNREKAKVPEHYVRNSAAVIFNASFGTLYAAFGNVVNTIIENPWILDDLIHENLLDTAVDELIRYDGPAQGTSRYATKDVEIAGVKIKSGDIVLALLAAANRDPQVFENPNKIILNRKNNAHLSFGWGPHICIGAKHGKTVIKELIKSLLELPKLRMTRPVQRRYTATVRCIDVLPLTFLP